MGVAGARAVHGLIALTLVHGLLLTPLARRPSVQRGPLRAAPSAWARGGPEMICRADLVRSNWACVQLGEPRGGGPPNAAEAKTASTTCENHRAGGTPTWRRGRALMACASPRGRRIMHARRAIRREKI